MYVKMYYVNEDKNEFERGGTLDGVTLERFHAARAEARSDVESEADMIADLHSEDGNILEVILFSRQMRDRVVAAMRIKS